MGQIFTPVYRTDVTRTSPTGLTTRVNPAYCLSQESAVAFVALLADPVKALFAGDGAIDLMDDTPIGTLHSGVDFSDMVPWLAISGTYRGVPGVAVNLNAGVMAWYWRKGGGHSDSDAMRLAMADITAALEQARIPLAG